MDLKGISNIIFDLGVVLFDLDYERTHLALSKFDITDIFKYYSKSEQHTVFDQIETGEIPAVVFYSEVRRITGKPIPDDEIRKAWNAMLLGIKEEKTELLERLKDQYSLYLLSNTNEIHLEAVKKMIEEQVGYQRFSSCFRKIYFSNEIGLRKPHPECFEYVLRDAGLNPNETLFIDDSPQHVAGAESVGIRGYHLKDHEHVAELFKT